MPETLTDHWIDNMDFDRLPWWVDRLGVTPDEIAEIGLREAIKEAIASDDHRIQAGREIAESMLF